MKYLFLLLSFTVLMLGACSGGSDDTSPTGIVDTVSADMVPASLKYELEGTSVKVNATADPCEEYSEEYGAGAVGACQPKLMRIYLEMAKRFMDTSKIMIEDIDEDMGFVADGETSTIDWGDGQIVSYSKTNATKYKVLIKENGVPSTYIDVNGKTIAIKIDFDVESFISDDSGKFEGTIEYQDKNNYTVTLLVMSQPCNSEDVSGPRNIKIIINKVQGVWSGYSMLYHPRWGGSYRGLDCNSGETADTGVLMYTNFVGNNKAAKVNAFVMKRTIADATFDSSLASYGIDTMCTNYSDILGAGGCTAAGSKMASFKNSYCNPADTLEALWENNCLEFDGTVASGTFPTGLWVYPGTFYNIEGSFSIPSSL